MLGIGSWELLAILLVALLIYGPDKLPELATKAAHLLRHLRRISSDVSDVLKKEMAQLERSAQLQEMKKEAQRLADEAGQVAKEIQKTGQDVS